MTELLQFIETIGFPIFLSFYLLHRIEEKLSAIHDALLQLPREVHSSNVHHHDV